MKDITHTWLDAALLDQVVAGKFHGRSYAFVPVMRDSGKPWGLGIAVENEGGYSPIDHDSFSWDEYDKAYDFCQSMNRHINLDPRREIQIIASTMCRAV